jgi:AcrR family transcriptional regulator
MTSVSAILDAAEKVFGTHGFEGGTMQGIAKEANVAQSLIHYHYKDKARLYEAVFERRAAVIRDVRARKLVELFEGRKPSEVHLEEVLETLFMSLEVLLGEKRGKLRYYVQMLAEVTISGNESSMSIVKKFYDPSAELFIDAFQKVVPNLSREAAVWAYLYAIGARMQAHAPNNRAARLCASSGIKSPTGYELLVPFVAAGIRSITAQKPLRKPLATARSKVSAAR